MKAFALSGRFYYITLNPGRCPGLGASALSGRVGMNYNTHISISLFRHRSEAQGELMSSCRSHVLWQTRVTTTAAVTDATLPEIEVSENLVGAYQVVRMLATIEYVVVELGIIEVRQREGYHALGGNL